MRSLFHSDLVFMTDAKITQFMQVEGTAYVQSYYLLADITSSFAGMDVRTIQMRACLSITGS